MKKPWILPGPLSPETNDFKLQESLDLEKARADFLKNPPSNLDFLLKNRYNWMNKHIDISHRGIELGCGLGVSRRYLHNRNYLLTDIISNDWIDQVVDSQNIPLEDNSLDFIIAVNCIHHFSSPGKFFIESARVLKNKGIILIFEPHLSLFFRVMLTILSHEGYNYNTDVFDPNHQITNPDNPWTANNAVADLLFEDERQFEQAFPFNIIRKQVVEFLTFPISGGVSYKTKTLNLPYKILKIIQIFDSIMVRIFPNIFGLGQRIVLENRK